MSPLQRSWSSKEELPLNPRSSWRTKVERKLSYGEQYLHVGNGAQAAVEAIGVFNLVLPSGLVLSLNNCHYAPFINRGVVSFSRLLDLGFIHTVTSNGISISSNGIFYFSANNDNVSKYNNNSIFSINKKIKLDLNSSYLWHCRLAHIGKTRMQKLHHEGILENINDESDDKCESCISGKMTKKPFNNNIERATDLLGLIHTDVCGPLRHVSRKGASYFLTFTADFSRYDYVYLLKHKHEVFETFKVFKSEVELQLGKKIKALRSDRGGEYLSQEFKEYLGKNGIVQHLTSPYTPLQNGVSERRNHTLLDSGRDYDLEENHMDTLLDPPFQCKVVRSKWDIQEEDDWMVKYTPILKLSLELLGFSLHMRVLDYEIWQMDVKTAFLNGRLDEDIYMVQPEGILDPIVDDILFMENNIPRLKEVRDYLEMCFSMKELGEKTASILGIKSVEIDLSGYLPMEVKHELSNEMCASTPEEVAYMKKVPYASAVGSIMYDVDALKGQIGRLLKLGQSISTESREVNRSSRLEEQKQTTIAMSATQAEYMAASEAAMEAVWIRKFVGDLGVMPSIKKPINMYCDNSAAIIFANDSGVMKGARHF
ncbi:retrotransposon protein, putative, ty1-copia subclass [Tanacetum coccineum]